ncbi:unnamed protein product, partial [Urochloa humidicola]
RAARQLKSTPNLVVEQSVLALHPVPTTPPHVAHSPTSSRSIPRACSPVRLLPGGSNSNHTVSGAPNSNPPPMSAAAAAAADESPESREQRRRSEAVAWLRQLLEGEGLPLPPPGASDDELRAALADGALLAAALRRLDEGGASAAAAAGGSDDVARFLATVERMGLPTFAASELDGGPMSAVIVCLLALRDRFGSHVVEGLPCSLEENSRMPSVEFPTSENGHGTHNSGFREGSKQVKGNLQKVSKSPGPTEPSSPMSRP